MDRPRVTLIVVGTLLFCCGWLLAEGPGTKPTEVEAKAKRVADDTATDELSRLFRERGYTEIPILLSPSGYLMVSVSVNENDFRLLLDTGSPGTCFDVERTKKLKLNWNDVPVPAAVDGWPDWDPSKKCRVEVMEVGGYKAHGITATALKMDRMNGLLRANNDLSVDGVLGSDFCRANSAIVDYPSLRMFLKSKK